MKRLLIAMLLLSLLAPVWANAEDSSQPPLDSWLPMEGTLSDEVTWQEDDATVRMSISGLFDMVFSTQEPVAYVGDELISMQDGIKIKEGRPCFSMRDASVFSEGMNAAINAIAEKDTSAPVAVIENGLYGQGTEEQNATVNALLGDDAREKFELYFQWYNVVHELGHSITTKHGTYDSNNMELRHMVDEEQLVNSFAVAFWMKYGEAEKLNQLETIVDSVLRNMTPPVDNMSHLDFMRNAVDEGRFQEALNMEIYGWFQYSIVRDVLRNRDTLDLSSILAQMTGKEKVEIQSQQTLVYPTLGKDRVLEILADVVSTLRNLGVDVNDAYVTYSTDPNAQICKGNFPFALLEPYINAGRIIKATK